MFKLEWFPDRKKEWRWRLKTNGRVVATSGEGYKRKDHCQAMSMRICGHLLDEPARKGKHER